ncbi:PTS sugar transporter subunit IIB [Companilactobacillus versmoldensis]|uniref:PTS system lactose cellobiose-specific transporter subunit IIB n=1 Tax=Companilactobacillus versmoldensis DSM 14857 = KCTC 3814 TaxID=1423815 RepID=A0A0R1SCK5_9LACO|nr:PTS lactose transporter subunit IIB [Companilactobacillus versmoldensis]KRL66816.1 PTS system lactose cellobiose-specific transporter subunit IIB [Companilactobacillus versmoldensis DSM 14857 = KCTC 3814]
MTKTILLTCGAGASSGFMAAAGRKAVKKMNLDINVLAKSEAEVAENLGSVDLLLIAPHLKYMLDDMKKISSEQSVKCAVIPQLTYGTLDGDSLIKFAMKELEE